MVYNGVSRRGIRGLTFGIIMLLFVLVNISATAGADANHQIVTIVPNSISAIYGHRQMTTNENIYSTSLSMSQIKQPLTLLTSAELNALSADDTSYATQAGKGTNDEMIYVNFTLPGVQSVNWLTVRSITSASADTTQLGLWNSTSPAGGGWTRLNSTAITDSFATLTYNVSSAVDIQKYTKIDNNRNLNFSMAVWTSGPSPSSLSADLFEVIINYYPDITPPASITDLKNISYAPLHINWTWTDPVDPDFSKVMIYLNGIFKANISRGVQYYDATSLIGGRSYNLSSRTVDINGNINATFVNHTATTYTGNFILKNGDFESDVSNWSVETIGGSVAPVVELNATDGAYQGNYYAKINNTLGSPGVRRAAYIRQMVTVPSDALTLNYVIKYRTYIYYAAPVVGVKIGDTILEMTGDQYGGASSDWVQRRWDITSYSGQTMLLEIFLEDLSGFAGDPDRGGWIGIDNIFFSNDTTPPASVTNLRNVSYAIDNINWTWTDPADPDFSKVMVYLDGVFKTNVSKGVQYYNATNLIGGRSYNLSIRTVDTSGNINMTMVSHDAITAPPDIAPPASITNLTNTSYSQFYINWTWNDPIDPDFSKVMIYLNDVFKTEVPKGMQYYNATNLIGGRSYTLSGRSVDTSGNINTTYVSHTATTDNSVIYTLNNSDFESNVSNWSVETIGVSYVVPVIELKAMDGPYQGNYYAKITDTIGNTFYQRAGYIKQIVTVPENATTLNYAIKYYSFGYATVGVKIGDTVLEMHDIGSSDWVLRQWDITTYRGQTVLLEIFLEDLGTLANGDAWIGIDNVFFSYDTPDTTPPASITNLTGTSYSPFYINWTWTDPVDPDFLKVMVYLDGVFKTDVPKGMQYYNATSLIGGRSYTLSGRTVDTLGNINTTYVSHTAMTDNSVIYTLKGGDFESDVSNWSIETIGGSYAPVVTLKAKDGAYQGIYYTKITNTLGNIYAPRAGYIRQVVTVPENATTLNYAIKYWIEQGPSVGVKIGDTVLERIEIPGASSNWVMRQWDIKSYRGQTVVLEIFLEDLYGQTGDPVHDAWIGIDNIFFSNDAPPASITNLHNVSYAPTYINWTWIDPADLDFSKVMIYLDGIFQTNVSKGIQYYNATSIIGGATYTLTAGRSYTLSGRTVNTLGNINSTLVSHTAWTSPLDTTPPASVTNLTNTSFAPDYINWTWTDPKDIDFAEVMIYLDGTFKTNVSKRVQYYNATGFSPDTRHTIATRTVDTPGNINQTWVNHTAITEDTIPPGSVTNLVNGSFAPDYINWTWTDPTNVDFVEVMVYLDEVFMTNVSRGVQYYNATGFSQDTRHTIATRTVDASGNINQTWANNTARTKFMGGITGDYRYYALIDNELASNKVSTLSDIGRNFTIPQYGDNVGWQTEVYVTDYSGLGAALTLKYYNSTGSLVVTENKTVPANGTYKWIPSDGTNSRPTTGKLAITSTENIVGEYIIYSTSNTDKMSSKLYTTADAATDLTIPQYGDNVSWGTWVAISDVSGLGANLTLKYYYPNGTLAMTEYPNITANGMYTTITSDGSNGRPTSGKLEITSDENVTGEYRIFSFGTGGILANKLFTSADKRNKLIVPQYGDHITFDTWVAVSDASGAGANLTIEYYYPNGTLAMIENRSNYPTIIPANGVYTFIPSDGTNGRPKTGKLVISSDNPVSGEMRIFSLSGRGIMANSLFTEQDVDRTLIVPYYGNNINVGTYLVLTDDSGYNTTIRVDYHYLNGTLAKTVNQTIPANGILGWVCSDGTNGKPTEGNMFIYI